jgi:CheY-like chemotaxis protein
MSKKILLADDSITIQKVIELTFSDEDFDVVTVGNGRLALEKLPEVRPDIVLCDIIMPEKDGYEVCEHIKASPATAHIPVLLLTGAFEPFDQERAARAGYDGSLAKPFEPETLIAKVKDLLARAPVRAPAPPPAAAARPAGPAPAAAAPPAVLPFPRPAPPPTPPPAASFIPDEPFGHLEEPEGAGGAGATLAPITEDESATLLAPPAPGPAASDSSTSTVMFHAGDLPWSTPPPAPPTPVPAPPAPAAPPLPATAREPEPVFLPEGEETAEVIEEQAVFEEVLEEDLDFGDTSLEPPAADTTSTVLFTPGVTLPPMAPADDGGPTGAFEPVRRGAAPEPPPAPPFEPEPVYEPEPEPVYEPEPEPVYEPEPEPVYEPEPEPVYEPEPMPAFEPEPVLEEVVAAAPEPAALLEEDAAPAPELEPGPPSEPQPVRPTPPESFADVAPAPAPEPLAPAVSEAANVPVPVEMVEKIAQRVVAQISEKAVREIAWEVIPDLAEALIKREIERLKAELQKT